MNVGTTNLSVTMIGHAGLLIEAPGIGLLTDPWLGGRIFDNSWELALPALPLADFVDRVTHVWISHEHPDHLHWPSLRAIVAARGPAIALLFQEHPSRAVIDQLGRLGFGAAIELRPGCWHRFGPAALRSLPAGRIDCGLAVRIGDDVIVNLNDAKLSPSRLRGLRRAIGRPRLIAAQFSIAGWQPPEADRPATKVLDRTIAAWRALAPAEVLLFASHARFCHPDNAWLNRHALPADRAVDRFAAATGVTPFCLSPGERWSAAIGAITPHAATRYAAAATPPALSPPDPLCDAEALCAAADAHAATIARVPWWHRRRVPKLVVALRDLACVIAIDLRAGRAGFDPAPACVHLEMTGAMLLFACTRRWGFDTLDVAGRYRVLAGTKDHPALRLLSDHGAGRFSDRLGKGLVSPRLWRRLWARRADLLAVARKIRRDRAAFDRAIAAPPVGHQASTGDEALQRIDRE
ncbi:MAG: hypothetical protein B7Y43_00240 [Sphingomonas sp. 28-62-20]|uniref:MBL fold metallo-hydrolase n=1 Tax=Sphingomonas sp. 28-62-20 TaxID=1970433 RepID=UPI000BD833B3|nr:MAG: hypothetical protein B7Y43_00240 [Sphingomonas sp. 28-62-20]